MTAHALRHGGPRIRPADVAFLVPALVHVGLVAALLLGHLDPEWTDRLMAVPALGLLLVLRRRALTPVQTAAIVLAFSASAGLVVAMLVPTQSLYLAALPGLAVSAVLCARFPVPAVLGTFLVCGTFGSLTAFWSYPAGETVDILLGGLWGAAIWGWFFRREKPGTAWLWPGVACMLGYVLLSAAEVLTADSLNTGLQAFRASIWYIAALLLVGYAPWPHGVRRAMVKGVVLVCAAVGGYAVLRWIIGPADAEREFAGQFSYSYLDGDLRPVGSFTSPRDLTMWGAVATPFVAAVALAAPSRRWRLAAIGTVVLLVLAMMAADVRAGPAALAPAILTVLLIHQLNPAFGPGRGIVTVVAVAVTILGAAAAFSLTLGDKEDSGRRYEAILDPSEDASYQARLFKWRSAVESIDEHPFGQGLGTAGRTSAGSRFESVATIDVDNSYLKIGLDQGFAVMVFFGFGMALLLIGLGRRALFEPDRQRAAVAAGACGTIVALAVLFYTAVYIEGLPALAAWMMVGLGISQVSRSLDGPGIG